MSRYEALALNKHQKQGKLSIYNINKPFQQSKARKTKHKVAPVHQKDGENRKERKAQIKITRKTNIQR